jgi:hypothetical protein
LEKKTSILVIDSIKFLIGGGSISEIKMSYNDGVILIKLFEVMI